MSALLAAARPEPVQHPVLDLDPAAVAGNVRTIASAATGPVMAVVKADGFGCDASAVARAALAGGAAWLGTATLAEAIALRRAGFGTPLLSWLHAVDEPWEAAVRLRIDVAVPTIDHLDAIERAALTAGIRARVHLHVDTGMARDGAPWSAWPALVQRAAAAERLGGIEVTGVMGHLPCADDPAHGSTAAGFRTFGAAVDAARSAGLRPAVRHLAATEAALRIPGAGFDLVRAGAGLVGIGPGLRPAVAFRAPVVLTRRVPAGTPVGYGHTGATTAETVLALLPVGYADGLPRGVADEASVQLGGRRCRLVGRVSMDQVVVDAGPGGVALGDTATVFGPGDAGEPTAADWARWAGTIEHEILTRVGARVLRTVGGER